MTVTEYEELYEMRTDSCQSEAPGEDGDAERPVGSGGELIADESGGEDGNRHHREDGPVGERTTEGPESPDEVVELADTGGRNV